jgi:metal-responsive CopG/Arc/MetJ family transcriptional regulator
MAERSGKQIFVRLPDELVAELDRYAEILASEQPGLNPSRSDAIRILLYRGLEAERARRQRGGDGE